MNKLLLSAVAALALFAGPASAVTYDLPLSGQTSNFSIFEQNTPDFHFDRYILSLTGLDSSNAIELMEGDAINATVTLDEALTVPASAGFTNYALFLFADVLPDQDTETGNGSFSLYLNDVVVASFFGGASTRSQIAGAGNLFPPDSGELTFDKFTAYFEITDLETPATVDGATFSIAVANPASAVPEPGAWAMMLIGFGGVGFAMRRRQLAKASFA